MAFTPTTNLSLPLIDTGTESGTWGELVDNGLTSYLDIAIAGGLAISITGSGTTVTLTKTAGTSSATGIGSTTAQYAILNISGAKTGACTLNLPITSKWYIINNAGTGGFLLTVRGVTPTTGVTLQDGEKAIVAWNGTDYVKVAGWSTTNNASYTSYLTESSTTLTNKPTLQFQRSGAQTNGTGNAGYISFMTNGPSAIGTYEAAKVDVTFKNTSSVLGAATMVMAVGNSVGSYTTRIELDGATGNGNINLLSSGNIVAGGAGFECFSISGTNETVLAIGAGGIGYGTGAGGTVTQATSISTNVTLNTPTGRITCVNNTFTSGTTYSFSVVNTVCDINSVYLVTLDATSTTTNTNAYQIWATGGSTNSFGICIRTNSTVTNTLVINFAIIKGAVA